MRKKSPILIIASVNGNFAVFVFISLSASYFDYIKDQQKDCYFGPVPYYTPDNVKYGDECMIKELSKEKFEMLSKLMYWISILCVSFFEYLALMPYLLRSLRIKKMF